MERGNNWFNNRMKNFIYKLRTNISFSIRIEMRGITRRRKIFQSVAESGDDTSSGYDEVTSDFEDEFQEVGKQGREREGKGKHCRFPFNI